MKTRIFSAALAAALVPALAACAAGGPASRGEASAGTATPQSAAADPGEAGSLQPLTPGTGQGYYVCGSNGGSPLLCYLDYASAAEVPLCARPNCEHNSESCTAWLPAGRMVSNLSAVGQGIAWIELDGIEGRVWLADADGAGRRQLPALPDGFAAETLAAQDGQALYCFASKYGEGQTTTALYRLPLDGGEAEQLLTLPQPVPELKGVCGRSLVLYQYDWSGIEDIPRPEIPAGADEEEARRLNDEYQEQVAQVTGSHRVYLLDVDTGAEQELAGWTSRQGSSGRAILWQDDTLYWTADEDTGHIGWLTAAGEKKLSSRDLTTFYPLGKEQGVLAQIDSKYYLVNGTGESKLALGASSATVQAVAGGYIYYTASNALYRISLDGAANSGSPNAECLIAGGIKTDWLSLEFVSDADATVMFWFDTENYNYLSYAVLTAYDGEKLEPVMIGAMTDEDKAAKEEAEKEEE